MMDCWPWSHKWSKWKVFFEMPITSSKNDAKIGIYTQQRRSCDKCGLMQIREDRL